MADRPSSRERVWAHFSVEGWRFLRRRHLVAVAQVAVVLAWFLFLRPAALGGPASYVIVSGSSMEPTLSGGDFVLALRQDDYAIGDLVAFRVPAGEPGEGAAVIHRILGREGEVFTTQGDNSDQPDTWHPTAQDILGQMRFSLPGGGRLVEWFRQPVILGAIAGLLGMSFVLAGGKPAEQMRQPKVSQQPSSLGGAPRRPETRSEEALRSQDPRAWPSPPGPALRAAAAPLQARGERSISTKDLLRWSRMDRRVVLRHPLPPEAEVYLVRSGNWKHWMVTAKGELLSDEAEKDERP